MAQSDTDSGTDTTKINIRISERLLAEADETWEDRGYNSRSEFIRQAIRDSVHTSRLSAQTLESLLVSKQQREHGETISSDEMRERYGIATADE
jgi:metal-responsive CopG/Arc/MetJ family transcriptional regulator